MKRMKLVAVAALVLLTTPAFATSKAFISEYAAMGGSENGAPQVAAEPAVADQVVDFSGGVTSSAAFNARTRYIRLMCDTRCAVKFGGAAAGTSNKPMAADMPEYFGVNKGDTVSVIASP